MTTSLFSNCQLGRISLRNRVVMAPMTRSRALGNVPNALMAEYYGQRAGAGLIVTEGVAPSPNGLGYARIPGLFSAAQLAGWRLVTEAVHARSGRIFAQIMHTGRIGHPANLPEGGRLVAPSAIASGGSMWTDQHAMQPEPVPAEMTLKDIADTQQEYETAAVNAIEAGFDGIELHAANGYLLEQFINPHVNQRTDSYGGTLEKRTKFVVEVAERVASRIGSGRVGIRFSPHGTFNHMDVYDEVEQTYVALGQAAKRIALAYVHAIRGPHVKDSTTAALRNAFGGTFILNGGFKAADAQATIDRGDADLIAFGSPFISNPDLVTKLKAGAELTAPKHDLFYTASAEGYTDYPGA
jgi:N-ethylmaleimide reductase